MKFTTFLKVFSISLAIFIGACGVGVGILAIAGFFSKPTVLPQNISFNQQVYNVDDDFDMTISTNTPEVTETTLTLSLQNGKVVTLQDGSVRISDGVISIPRTAVIGEPFKVYLETTKNDSECNGMEWITGGHSKITATSTNQKIDSISADVNVDVPVYRVELETRLSAQGENLNSFAVGSTILANLKFYPARSAYSYSQDGKDGGKVVYKNTYFMPASSNDANITQNGFTNEFKTNNIGTSNIVGYVFSTTPVEERVLLGYENLDEATKNSAILARLEQLATDTSTTTKQAYRADKTVEMVEVEVDSMRIDGSVSNANVDTLYTLYANNKDVTYTSSQSSLNIVLYSSLDESISLQHELNNVGIRFLYKVGNTYYDAVNNENNAYNVVTLPDYGYGETRQVSENGQTYTYYMPVITQNIDEYFWQFAVLTQVDSNNLRIEVKYFGDTADEVDTAYVDFSTNMVQDSMVYWSTEQQTLTIVDGENPVYNSLNVEKLAVVPQNNLYKTRAYFVMGTDEYNVSDYIVTKGDAQTYQLGAQTVTLYEIEDGIIQPKSKEAFGKTFDVVFVTIQTDYQGNPKYDADHRYVISRFSQDSLSAISTLQVYIDKTLYGLTNNLKTSLATEDLIINPDTNDIAYVQNTTAPFEVVVGYTLPNDASQNEQANEQLIFRNVIQSGNIKVIAKLLDTNTETTLIYSTSGTEQSDGTEYVFSMNVGSLADNVSERRVKLYVVYTSDVLDSPIEYEITTYNDGQLFDCIEVYDGLAQIFDFNANIAEDGAYKSSADNRILVTSNILEENGYINSIQTTYTLNANDVSPYLFETVEQGPNYSTLAVVVKDKYGNIPLSSEYTLESSNTSILTVSNNNFTFNGAGDVEVYLRDAKGEIKDTLYFTRQQNGYVSQVEKMVESTQNGISATKSSSVIYNRDVQTTAYDFPQISVPLRGYAGSTINLKATTIDVVNVISYEYTYDGGKGLLTSLERFSLVDAQDIELLDDYVEFQGTADDLSGLRILRDFGKSYSLQLRVTIAELGISQTIVLDIAQIVTLSVDSYGNDYEEQPKSYVGNVQYLGAYADSLYHVMIQMNYSIGTGSDGFYLDNSKYSLYLYEYDSLGQQISRTLLPQGDTTSANAYIVKFSSKDADASNTTGIGRENGTVLSYVYHADIVFKSGSQNGGYRWVMVALEKNGAQNTTIDSVGSLYLYINPNVRVKQNSNEILLSVANGIVDTVNYYGQAPLLSTDSTLPLVIDRVVDSSSEVQNANFDIDLSKIAFRFVDDTNNFYIKRNADQFVIYSLANIQNSTEVSLVVTYNGVDVLTGDGSSYEVKFTIKPNVTKNPDSTMWVLYKGEYYLKLINGKQYTFDEILNSFQITTDGSATVTSSLEIASTTNVSVQGQTVTIQGVNNNLIDTFSATIHLNNGLQGTGDSLDFKILLLPFDVPFVIYPNALNEEYDLYDLLNIDYVIDEGLYYTLQNGGLGATDILIEEGEQIDDTTFGFRYVPTMQLSVENLDKNDKNIYAYFDGTNFYTEAVGRDTFVIIRARISVASDSLVIPYLVKLEKVLDIRTFYPYQSQYSQNTNITGSMLYGDVNNVTFDMEYLSFDDNDEASVDLLEPFSEFIPNSKNATTRVAIGRTQDGEFEEQAVALSTLTFKISEVAYYFYQWQTAQNVAQYATINSGVHGNSVVKINRGGAQYVRVKVQMTTTNGLEAYYYISVGEIPTLSFTQRTDGGVYSTDIKDINLSAGENQGYALGDGKYGLSMTLGSSSSTTNAIDLLKFYVVPSYLQDKQVWVDTNDMILYAEDTTENFNTQFVFYTKFGVLKVVNLFVLSNYEVAMVEPNTSMLTYNEMLGLYEIDCGNIIDINDTFKVNKNDGDLVFTTFDDITITVPNSVSASTILAVEEDGHDIIKIGMVANVTDVNIMVKFTFMDQDEQIVYNFTMRLRIYPTLSVATAPNGQPISSVNMLPVSGVLAGDVTQLDILSDLFDYSGDDFDAWYKNVIDNKLGFIAVELITQSVNGSFEGSVIDDGNGHYVISLNVSEVADITNLSFRVVYYNCLNGVDEHLSLVSYFGLTLSPNFIITNSYPAPNQDTVAVAESYWFDRSENAQNIISLADVADLADNARIVVQDLNGQNHQQNIVVRVGLGSEFVYVNGEKVYENYYALDTDFEIREDVENGVTIKDGQSIQFSLFYRIDGAEVTYVPVGVYNVVILNNIYSLTGYNFNASVALNSLNNKENIYIGSNDDILTKIRLTLTIPDDADLSTTKYIKVSSVNGINAQSSMITLAEGMQGDEIETMVVLLDLNVEDMTAFIDSEEGVRFEVYTLDANSDYQYSSLTNKNGEVIEGNIKTSFESRIQLSYRTVTSFDSQSGIAQTSAQNIEFFKQYKLLSGTNCTLETEDITSESNIQKVISINSRNGINIADGVEVGTYYVNYGFDIEFENTQIELSAGQNTSVLHNGTSANDNYISLLNMKRSSDKSYYVKEDFSGDGLTLSIDPSSVSEVATNDEYADLVARRNGYLRFTPTESQDETGVYYDYNFMAQGAPKETSVTVTLALTVSYGSIEKQFTLTFIVSNDYINETLRNSDGTINSEINRNMIRDYNFVDYLIFAHWGSAIPSDNFIFIEHENESQNQKGNVASLFNVTYAQGGEYLTKYEQSGSSNYDLAFKFTNVKYGNKNIDLILTDEYGYTIRYYITLVAQYNVLFNTGSLTAFELESVGLVNQGESGSKYDHAITVAFQKRDATDPNIELSELIDWKVVFTYDDINGDQQEIRYVPVLENDQIHFNVDYINETFDEGRLSGTLTISANSSEEDGLYEIKVEIPTTIRERYSLVSNETPYVRDGVAFSLLDVIDVVDNSQNYVVGDRSLKDSYTIYLQYNIRNDKNESVSLSSVANVLQLRIRAHNTKTNEDVYATVPVDSSSGSYLSIEDLFGFEDISNYQFRIFYEVTTYTYKQQEGIDIPEKTSSVQENFTYTSNGSSVAYDLSFETSSGYKGSSNLKQFSYTYFDGSDGQTVPEGDNWPIYSVQISSYIVQDQIFTIGMRQLDNDSMITIHFVNQQNSDDKRTVNISADRNAVVKYSLKELGVIDSTRGEKMSLYTNNSRTIIDGINVTSWANLKGISFTTSIKPGADQVTNSYDMTKYIEKDAEFLTSTDGLNVEYVDDDLIVDVAYAYENGKAQKVYSGYQADVWITLKFVDVDATLAYGSEQQRNARLPSNYMTDGIEVSDWAGTTYRPFELVAGYTTATSFIIGQDTTLSGNAGDLAFGLSTLPSAGSQYVEIEEETGKITLKEGFDTKSNYVLIDVYVKYGPDGESGKKLIDTVRVYFSAPENATLSISARVSKLARYASEEEGKFNVSIYDILEMISISDGYSNVWTDEQLLSVFGVSVGFYSSRTANGAGGYDYNWVSNMQPVSYEADGTIKLTITIPNEHNSANLRIDLTRSGNVQQLILPNVEFVESKYSANSMTNRATFEYVNTGASTEGDIFNALLPYLAVQNIYGNIDYGYNIFGLSSDVQNYYTQLKQDGNVTCEVSNKDGLITSYQYKFGKNVNSGGVVYGVVTVLAYSQQNENTIVGNKTGITLSVGENTQDIINNDLMDFDNMSQYGYATRDITIDEEQGLTSQERYISIPYDVFKSTDWSSIDLQFSLYINGHYIQDIQSDSTEVRGLSFNWSNEYALEIIFLNYTDVSTFENKIFTIKTLDEAYSFVFINEEVELSEISSTLFLNGVGNIFALLAQINGVSENDIYVRLYSQENLIGDEQYVSLVNQGGSYTLVLTGGTEPVRDLTVKIEFYISLYSFDGVDKTDFILYENTIVISQTNN